jgi:rhodanese-related sulfurtransferase
MRAGLAALVLLLASAAAGAEETPRIDARALLERVERKDATLTIVDVRTPEEFAMGHVPGAINIPYTHLPARSVEIAAPDNDIVLYCGTGVRAERAATRLREHGYTRLLHLDGDMKGWAAAQLPIEK